MVGATVALLILVAFLVTLPSPLPEDPWRTPEYTLDCGFDEERGLFVINVTSARDVCSVSHCDFDLSQENGSGIPGFQGEIEDIYGANMNIDEVNISFMDTDRSGTLTRGDQFHIRAWSNETQYGVGREGQILRLDFGVTGECMGKVRLVK